MCVCELKIETENLDNLRSGLLENVRKYFHNIYVKISYVKNCCFEISKIITVSVVIIENVRHIQDKTFKASLPGILEKFFDDFNVAISNFGFT